MILHHERKQLFHQRRVTANIQDRKSDERMWRTLASTVSRYTVLHYIKQILLFQLTGIANGPHQVPLGCLRDLSVPSVQDTLGWPSSLLHSDISFLFSPPVLSFLSYVCTICTSLKMTCARFHSHVISFPSPLWKTKLQLDFTLTQG